MYFLVLDVIYPNRVGHTIKKKKSKWKMIWCFSLSVMSGLFARVVCFAGGGAAYSLSIVIQKVLRFGRRASSKHSPFLFKGQKLSDLLQALPIFRICLCPVRLLFLSHLFTETQAPQESMVYNWVLSIAYQLLLQFLFTWDGKAFSFLESPDY